MKENDYINTILNIREEERRRIAADLHDTSLQSLTFLSSQIELAKLELDKDIDNSILLLTSVNERLHDIIDEIRNIIYVIRPTSLNDLGFVGTVYELIECFNNHSMIRYSCKIDGIDDSYLTDSVSLELYRIVEECIHNCEKHSKAHNVRVTAFFQIDKEDNTGNSFNLKIGVEDDGVGFDTASCVKSEHFGLEFMKFRAKSINAKIDIKSDIGKGTIVTINYSGKKDD